MTDTGPGARPEVVIATSNPGKLGEIRAILTGVPIRLRGLDAFPDVRLPDEGEDYQANAVAKARAAASQTRRPALADDSGLEVDGLEGAPGPRSARFGGEGLSDEDRVRALLAALEGKTGDARRARFVCVAALAAPDGAVCAARGECAGSIAEAPRGDHGFGYDPVFVVEGGAATLAELPAPRKNRISHRARAFRELRDALGRLAGPG